MKRILVIWLLIIVVLISGCYGQKTTAEPAATETNTVEIKGFAFNPTVITVSKGTTVIWTHNDGAPHTITGANFDSGTLNKGQTFSQTFNGAGTFEYSCTIHPSMKAKVIVT